MTAHSGGPSSSDTVALVWLKQFGHDLAIYCLQKEQKGVQMLVDKNIKKIQVPAVGKTISVPAVAAAMDSRTTAEPPSTEPSSMEPPSTEPPSKEEQPALSAAVAMNRFEETVDPKDYPTLDSKNICLKTDKDISLVLQDIMKLSKKVRSVDLLKVLNYNNTTTSLVEVPCSVKQSGFKKQARRSQWVQRILQCV
jgi:hypothetical protein